MEWLVILSQLTWHPICRGYWSYSHNLHDTPFNWIIGHKVTTYMAPHLMGWLVILSQLTWHPNWWGDWSYCHNLHGTSFDGGDWLYCHNLHGTPFDGGDWSYCHNLHGTPFDGVIDHIVTTYIAPHLMGWLIILSELTWHPNWWGEYTWLLCHCATVVLYWLWLSRIPYLFFKKQMSIHSSHSMRLFVGDTFVLHIVSYMSMCWISKLYL